MDGLYFSCGLRETIEDFEMKKTIAVGTIKEEVNAMLACSEDSRVEFRKGMMFMLEKILNDTGNYKGYRYLAIDEINGSVPGINEIDYYVHPELKDPDAPEYIKKAEFKMKFEGTDNSRVCYF